MKLLKFFGIGIYFGIVLTKSEAVSWFRIQEMFYFQSFHMYGIIFMAIVVGLVTVTLIRVFHLKTVSGEEIALKGKPFNRIGNTAGGVIFGLGWALAGACPGPLYALLGSGYWAILLAILGALLGTLAYGKLKPVLPH
ncbi:MAG: YeeE/YedE family protein [Spirochaetaceae bacterium]|nr:MAG: YeeE/YedE family protein [Spirochaetaceae bacterium]